MKKFKINNDTMTTIVVVSLIFCVLIVITGFVFVWFGKDISAVLSSSLAVFGTELGICGLMTIFRRWTDAQGRKKGEEWRNGE